MDIITGATGIIGSALSRQLKDAYCVVRPNSPRANNITTDKIIWTDLKDIWKASFDFEADTFYHLAWSGTDKASREDVFAQFSNIGYTLNAVNIAHSLKAKTFVFAGSQAEYGIVDHHIYEDLCPNPVTAYGAAKLSAGHLAKIQCKKLGIKFVWARIFSAYGINDSDSTMIIYLIDSLLNNKKPSLSDCTQKWDYMYCDEVAKALIFLSKNGKDGEIYNIASGDCKELKEFVREILETIYNLGIGENKSKKQNLMPKINKILTLGFEPETNFKEGIEKTIQWRKDNGLQLSR